METNLLIPQQLAQAICNYLIRQPYADVAPLVQEILRLPKAPESSPPTEETAKD